MAGMAYVTRIDDDTIEFVEAVAGDGGLIGDTLTRIGRDDPRWDEYEPFAEPPGPVSA